MKSILQQWAADTIDYALFAFTAGIGAVACLVGMAVAATLVVGAAWAVHRLIKYMGGMREAN